MKVILAECKAPRHNNITAARGKNEDGEKCICPEALRLLEADAQRMRDYTAARTAARRVAAGFDPNGPGRGFGDTPRWLKQGPWRILQECPARGHNNLTWARSGGRTGGPACICPRALAKLAEYNESRSAIEKAQRKVARPSAIAQARVPEPDWRRGACRTDIATAERGFVEDVSKRGIADRAAAKELCQECPISMFRQCRAWIAQKEAKRPGSLGGVYAGMDKWNRQGVELKLVSGKIKRVPYEPSEV